MTNQRPTERVDLVIASKGKTILSRVTYLGLAKESPYAHSVASDSSLGKSIHHLIPSLPLRSINSLESSSLNWNALSPS